MGYKLAGFDVVGGVEIDPEMMSIYRANFNPRHSYLMGVQQFNEIPNHKLPEELFNLDILDGSPPCSSFSMAGLREEAWGESKKFREGQAVQVLDDLFFHFITTAKKLKPRVVIAENVKGLILGNAKGYVKKIFEGFNAAGYDVQLFLLNASRMGVPQARERTFFIGRRKDLLLPQFNINFSESPIVAGRALEGCQDNGKPLTETMRSWWMKTPPGKAFSDYHPKKSFFNSKKLHPQKVPLTQTSTTRLLHWISPRQLSDQEVIRVQSFPEDYNFKGVDVQYVCGMSVPPLMMQRVAAAVLDQLL